MMLKRNSLAQRIVTIVVLATGLSLGTMMAAFLLLDGISSRALLASAPGHC